MITSTSHNDHMAAERASGDLLALAFVAGEASGLPQQIAREITLLNPASQLRQHEVDAHNSANFSNGRSKKSIQPEMRIAAPAT